MQDSFLDGTNVEFIQELFCRFSQNPNQVDESWQSFFKELSDDERNILNDSAGVSWEKSKTKIIGAIDLSEEIQRAKKGITADSSASESEIQQALYDTIRAKLLIRSYRVRGHLMAQLDPLSIEGARFQRELDPASYGFEDKDYDRAIFIGGTLGLDKPSLRELMAHLQAIYCRHIGVEYMHIQDDIERKWLQDEMEPILNTPSYDAEGQRKILNELIRAEGFEKFLNVKYTGTKRFGLDGGESTIPALERILEISVKAGVEEVVLGMPHRGRLNILSNVFKKPYATIFSEFRGNITNPDEVEGSGDVKYHLGTSADRMIEGREVHVSLLANPSHLEAVNPIVLGKVRAKQDQRGDHERRRVMGVLMHGDASFAGQGVVAESLMLSDLNGYKTGGTIHLIVNNQIGFTTKPSSSRSGPYPSDLARMIQAPIFHVNGDDPEAVCYISELAARYRHKFGKDVVIDLFCYRRHGHNEGDEPSFTQPLMYQTIGKHKTSKILYEEALIDQKILDKAEVDALEKAFHSQLEDAFKISETERSNDVDWLEGKWDGIKANIGQYNLAETAMDAKKLQMLGKALTSVPETFNAHRKITRQLVAKAEMLRSGKNIDWATAEALAFASLLSEGHHVRLSGQDSGRGTFSQRHSILYDQKNEEKYIPLNHISEKQGIFDVYNSPLSEFAVMGFDYGYSLAEPNSLILWEGQFGDFANGAQVMMDQFISSAESKWFRMSGLVLLLPHGYEGSGPEHSSARVERYLQLCAEGNMQVANCTTPANYFHILRSQLKRSYRKPLILMTPKSLLRHKLCVSDLKDMTIGSHFKRVIDERNLSVKPASVKRIVLCSGKVFYDLYEKREARQQLDVALISVEQLYPYPDESIQRILKTYLNAEELIWCQEEPQNMGAWHFIDWRLEASINQCASEKMQDRPIYVGRVASASPATGSMKIHLAEQAQLVEEALGLQKINTIPDPRL